MKSRAMPVDRLEEFVGAGNGDEVMPRAVIGRHPADADISAGRRYKLLRLGQDQAIGYGLRGNMKAAGQPFALVDREDGELLQEREAAFALAASVTGVESAN